MTTDPTPTPETPAPLTREQAREKWIRRYSGYFGDPLFLPEYRKGEISFDEMRDHALHHAENMVSEASHCDGIAHEYE